MNVRRYTASGITQSIGNDEMFYVRWLVTPRSVTEPRVERASHRTMVLQRGAGSASSAWPCRVWFARGGRPRLAQASPPQSRVKIAKPADQPTDCCEPLELGSKR